MITNLLEVLHMTAAYQAAAMQLMIGQATFAARQLGLDEPIPLVIQTNDYPLVVSPPPLGVGGIVSTSHYRYEFMKGRLTYVNRRLPASTVRQVFTNEDTVADTNAIYGLATNWLSKLSIDVDKLCRLYPPSVKQGHTVDGFGRTNLFPNVQVIWTKNARFPVISDSPIVISIWAKTRQLNTLSVRDGSFYNNEPLRVTNAAELLGPTPSAKDYVEELVGGPEAYNTISAPDKVEAWLLNGRDASPGVEALAPRKGPARLGKSATHKFSKLVRDFNTYAWTESKMCGEPDYGLRLRFTSGSDVVEFLFCFECDILQVSHNGKSKEENFDFGHNQLLDAVRTIFPRDGGLKKIDRNNPEERRRELFGILNQYEK